MKKLKRYLFVPLIFLFFVIFLGNISGLFVSRHSSGGFPYYEYASREKLPEIIRFLTNFDGTQYLIIAESGYFTYQQAFFPLYPAVSSFVGRFILAGNTPLALIAVSFVSFVISIEFLRRLFEDSEFDNIKHLHKLGVFALLMLPGSFFFVAAYTESIFLALLLSSLYFAKKRNLLASFFTGALLGLTRLIGTFSSVLIYTNLNNKTNKYIRFIVAFGPVLGLLIYMFYLQTTTNDPLAFVNSQKAFNNNRSTSIVLLPQVLYRYLKIIFTVRNFDFVYLVSIFELITFCIYSGLLSIEAINVWGLWRRGKISFKTRFSLLIFSIINLILPTLTGTFSSIPRYGLMSISIIPAIFALNKYLRLTLLLFLGVINVVMLFLFVQGWFVS